MLVRELTETRQDIEAGLLKVSTPKEAVRFLTAALGEPEGNQGLASKVWFWGDRVIKVTTKRDPCYTKFIKTAMGKGKGNPHFPRVFLYRELKDNYPLVVMERIRVNTNPPKEQVTVTFDGDRRRVRASIFELMLLKKNIKVIPEDLEMIRAKYPDYDDTARLLRKIKTLCRIDVHSLNHGVRDDGTPVVIDPLRSHGLMQ